MKEINNIVKNKLEDLNQVLDTHHHHHGTLENE